nr:hypothetical protein [Tanacetum cinerariifolium]
MRTLSSSNLPIESLANPSTSNPKRRNRRRSKQPFILEESLVATMDDQRTMAELLRAPTEGYVEAIVVLPILAEQFKLKHILINMMTSDQFFRLEKDNPHDHIRRTTNLCNEISNFQQQFDESFHVAWDRYKDFLCACLHHGFTELHQLDTFYNALNPADQDSLNAAAGGNLLERRTQDVLTIIENKSKVRNSRNKSVASQIKSCDANSNSSSEIAKLTHAVNQQPSACLAAGGNTFLELRDNIQGYVSAVTVNYNQGNSLYRPLEQSYQAPTQQNQVIPLNELEKVKRMNEANMKSMQTQINIVKNELRNEMKNSIQASLSNQTNEIKNMIASLFQMNSASTSGSGYLLSNTVANPKGELKAITTISGIVLDGPTVPTPPPFINPEEDERVEETLTDPDLSDYTIKVPPPPVQKYKPPSQREFVLHINITLADALILMPKYQKMLKALLSNKEKLQELANTPLNENYSAVILQKLPEKLGDPGKFLIPCGFMKLKCKALADLGASINLMPLSVWKKLGLPELISTRMTLKLANRAICTPAGIARDSPPYLGKTFLRTARALIDVHGEEMILRNGDERLTLNMRHDTSSNSNQPQKESINLINVFNNSSEDFLEDLFLDQPGGNPTFLSHPELTSPKVKDDIFNLEGGNVLPKKLLDLDSTKDLHPPLHPLSGSTTYSSNPLLEEFADELALITFPLKYDDDLKFDVDNLANLADNFVDSMPKMFTDEHAFDYSSHPIFNEYDDDFLEDESDTENVYDDPFDSKGEKIKESNFLIDELDLPCDFIHPSEYDSFISQDFSRVDAKRLTNNEEKVFNPCILNQENPFEIITRVVQDMKLATSNASLVIEDFDPPFHEPLFFKEVPRSKMLLLFSSENEEKVFKPGIHTSKKVHSSRIPKLSHQGYKVFKKFEDQCRRILSSKSSFPQLQLGNHKIPLCCNNDDDEESSIPLRDIIIFELPPCIAITPVVSTKDSLIMGDEHLDTISETKSNELIKSSVENLIPNPSESEDEHECDVPACYDYTTFSNLLFDADDNFSSGDDESFSDEDIPKEIFLDISSSKIYSLFDEFAGELILLKLIPAGIEEADFDSEEEISHIDKLLYDNSTPRPPEEFIFENSDATIESFSPSHILVEDSDSLRDEMDLSLTPNDSMPPGIEDDDYDSKGDILILTLLPI